MFDEEYFEWPLDQLVPLKEKQENDEDIDAADLKDYAEHIGINMPNETHLLYLAYEGYAEKLPPQWQAYQCPNEDKDIVYRNFKTGRIIREHPVDQIYRKKVIEARNQQYSQSEDDSVRQLSQIEQDENDLRNQSELFQKGRYSKNNGHQYLRLPINGEGIKILNELKIRQESKLQYNSELDRNISEKDETESFPINDSYSNKFLPSSLLKEDFKSGQQLPLEEYMTSFTRKESRGDNSLDIHLIEENARLCQSLKKELHQLQKQERLKLQLLKDLEEQNNRKLEKIKKRLKKQRKHNA